jgi:hypothetical protein
MKNLCKKLFLKKKDVIKKYGYAVNQISRAEHILLRHKSLQTVQIMHLEFWYYQKGNVRIK